VKAEDGSSESSIGTPPNFDPSDPKALRDLLSQPPEPINHSPTLTTNVNEQTVVTECAQGGAASTAIGNLGGKANTHPSSSLPGSAALSQHSLTGGSSNSGGSSPNGDPNGNPNSNDSDGGGSSPNGNPNGGPNSGNSGGNDSSNDQGGTSGGNDPHDLGPDPRDLNRIILDYKTGGGPLEHWGTQGAIRAEEFFQFTGARDPLTHQWVLQSKRQLRRPEIVDRVADRMSFLCQHNDSNRVRAIVDCMPLFVLTVPNAKMEAKGTTLLKDDQESTRAMCHMLGRHLAFARTLPPERLPLRAPLLF